MTDRPPPNIVALLAVLDGACTNDPIDYEWVRDWMWRDYGINVDGTQRVLKRAEVLGLVTVDRSRNRARADTWTVRKVPRD